MFGGKSGQFDRYLERATSQLLLEPDWDSILQICDSIRQTDVQTKYAISQIRKKVNNENPHVAMFALQVLESIVKNCGSSVHEEIVSKEFMEYFKDLVKKKNDPVKGKILELIQCWSHAFRNEPSYKMVQDTFHVMKMEGYQFPVLKEADAMFMAEKAPEWQDGECCHRCRVQFSTFQRKHHCRNCGQVFCSKCSSKSSIIPRFGIEREVRVCEACFDQLNKNAAGKKEEDLPAGYVNSSLAQQSQMPPAKKSEQEIQEEEELQLALALSMSEAAEKEKQRDRMRANYSPNNSNVSGSPSNNQDSAPSSINMKLPTALDVSDMDPELARYLNRNYWEQKQDEIRVTTTQPSAPVASVVSSESKNGRAEEKYQNGDTAVLDDTPGPDDADEAQFLAALQSSIQIFVNRMKSNSQRGRSIANDSSVQTLFLTLNSMHPQLMTYIQKQEDQRTYFESLQDKLAQLKDAREALNDLRDEHHEKKRREMEELERQRQIAMAQRLEKLRQKKQEYLEYQRQLAMQRLQEQEREMAMRLEQQKQMQQMRAMQYNTLQQPQQQQMYPGAPVSTFSPVGSAEGSPHHQQYAMSQYTQQYPNMPNYPPPQYAPPGQMPLPQMPQQAVPAPGYPAQDFAAFNMQGLATGLPVSQSMQQQQQQQQPPQQQQGSITQSQIPQGQLPPGQIPPGQIPPGQLPPGQLPQGQLPQGQLPPGQLPPGQLPQGQLPQGQLPPGQLPPGQLPPGQIPPGQLPPGQLPQGQLPPGQLPQGQLPPGQIPSGQIPASQIPQGQFPPGQLPPGQLPPGQLPQGVQLSTGQYPDQGVSPQERVLSNEAQLISF